MKKLFLATICALCAMSCVKDNSVTFEEQMAIDEALILDYLEENNYSVQKTDEGVYYHHWIEGTGAQLTIEDDVTVHYRGSLLDGTIFDCSYGDCGSGNPVTFALSGVIQGWQIGIPLMKENGRTLLVIPSRLAYGTSGPGSIPANAVLAFEVELLDVQ